jgi:hypothetical protein
LQFKGIPHVPRLLKSGARLYPRHLGFNTSVASLPTRYQSRYDANQGRHDCD